MAHGDYTGQRKAVLAKEYADQQQLAAQSKTLVTQVVREGSQNTIDLFTEEDRWAAEHATKVSADGQDVQIVDVKDPQFQPVKFRASETVEQVTVGQNREFNIDQGQVYVAPRWVVEHLDDKGLVWH